MPKPNTPPTPTPAPAPEPAPAPTPAPEPAPAPAPETTFTQAQFDAEKKKWEKEWTKKLSDAEAKAKLSEDEKLKADLAEAQKQLRERDARDAATAAAEKAGVKNARLFYNAYKDDFEFDDKGGITNLKDVLGAAKTESPELFGAPAPKPEGGADAGDGKQPPAGLTKEKIASMSDAEIAENMEAIDKFLSLQQ